MVDSLTTSSAIRPSTKRTHSRRSEEDDAFLKLTTESSAKLEKLAKQEDEDKKKESIFGKVCFSMSILESILITLRLF
jgi:hypothetical protein